MYVQGVKVLKVSQTLVKLICISFQILYLQHTMGIEM